MTVTLTTELRDPNAPASRAQWAQLWRSDGTPVAEAWEGLAGPPGPADGDTYPTRPGDHSHPATPATVEVDAGAEVVLLATPAIMAAIGAHPSELVTRWFAPGTITTPFAFDLAALARVRGDASGPLLAPVLVALA